MAQASSTAKEQSHPRGTFVSNFSIVVRVHGEFSFEQLEQALDCVRPRHRLLITSPGKEDLASEYFSLRCLPSQGNNAWKEIVKEELRLPFPGGPFARFTCLQSQDHADLVGTFHHGVCDGFSGVYVMRDVLQALGDPDAPVAPLPVPPHLSMLIPGSVITSPRLQWQLRKTLTTMHLALSLGRLRRRILPKPPPVPVKESDSTPGELPPNLRMCILTQTLTASQTARLVQCSRAEGTTIHAAICTAWLRAFANTLPGKASRMRRVSSPISLRNRLIQAVPETAGMFLSTGETRLHCKPGRDFWEMAREFHARFKRDTTDAKLFVMPLLFGAFARSFSNAEMGEAVRMFFGGPVKYDFSITNLGRLDFPAQIGPLRIEAFHNLVNSSEHERTVNVNTFDGRMTFIFIFRESKMAPDEGEQLMGQAIQQLAEVSGG
jgi:hypothetical protein